MFVCYSKSAHEYEQNKVEAYFMGRVLSFVDWIRTLIPEPYLIQDLMELTISWIFKECNLHLVNGLQVPKTCWRLFCSIFFPFGRHRILVYDHSGVQASGILKA